MKKRMIIKRLSLLTLSTVFASNIVLPSMEAYAEVFADGINYNIEEEGNNNQENLNESDYNKIGGVEKFSSKENEVFLDLVTGEKIRISFLKDDVLRIYMDPTGNFQEDPTPNNKNHVTKIINKTKDKYENPTPKIEDGEIIRISTDIVELRVEKATSKMELFNKKTNKTIWKEKEPLKHKGNSTIQTLESSEDEYFYGGGMQNGRFSHKGKKINIKNENNWVDGGVASPNPFYFSTKGYGVMRHTFKPGEYDFEFTEKGKVITKHAENRFDAYYFIDEKPTDIIDKYTELTGEPVLLPEYGFYLGHANCYSRDWINDETGQESQTPRPGFDRQESLMVDAKKVVDDHISNDTPLGWFLPNDGYGCGYGREDTIDGNINNLKEFVDYARGFGIQTGLWTQSSLKPTGNQEAYLERDIDKEVGVAGTNGVKTDVAWVGEGYSFALNSVRQAAEGIVNNSKDRARPFIVSLDGWAGTQRYASIWSGDQSGGEWEYIRFHIPTYIGSGLSGQPNVGSDMDGIFGGSKLVQTRDFQWKAFTPVQIDMDGWGANAKYPYVFGEPYTSINRMYLKLKAEMMPYNYSISSEATNDGVPMIRAMMLEYPEEYTYGTDTQYQYMWGPNMLVAPIYQNTNADSEGNDVRNDIYLPDDDQIWIDYFTGKQYLGGGVLNNFEAPLWKLPVFVKNGAIIPMTKENNNPERVDDSHRIYEIYPSGETSFEAYEDDGLTVDYKDGKSATTIITSSAPKRGKGEAIINVGLLKGDYENIVLDRTTEFIVNVSEKPSDIKVKIGDNDLELKEVNTLEEFERGTNVYFYDEAPNLNKYATSGSEFEKVKITSTPKLKIKVEKTNVKENEINLVIKDFNNTQEVDKNEVNNKLSVPNNFKAKEEEITSDSIKLTWDKVEGANSYDLEIDGVIFKNITTNEYKHSNLNYDTEYNYRVRSVNKDGHSNWSELVKVKTDLDPYRNVPKNMKTDWKWGQYSSDSPQNSVDGNDSTQFHSKDSAIDKPFIIDMQKAYTIEKLELLFRKNGNGSVKRAEIYSSLDGINYEKIFSNAKGSNIEPWVTDGEVKTIEFKKPIKARYFKIVTKESIGNFLTMREFRPYMVEGTTGQVVGDWNNSGALEEGDLVFLENYAGLTIDDSDWGYVSMADLNKNGLIDAYDIAYVASQLENGLKPTEGENLEGSIMVVPSKDKVSKGETFTIDLVGTGLSDINAFSAEIPLDSNKYEYLKTDNTILSSEMRNLSKARVHTDGTQDIYVNFVNVGNKTKLFGTDSIARITLKAKQNLDLNLEITEAMLVDSKLNSKEAIAKLVDLESDLPSGRPTVNKVDKKHISVYGDSTQLQAGMGLDKLIDGTTSSDDSSRMDLKWIFSSDQEDKGRLPFEMTFKFDEPKYLENFTIYNRVNADGSINIAALKKVRAKGYLNGKEFDLGEKSNINSATTVFELKGQKFDKIVITALESHKDKNTLAINEVEFYEKSVIIPSEIYFDENSPESLYLNKITPIFAKVKPNNANNLNYKLYSEDPEILQVLRVDEDENVKYYLRGLKPGVTKIFAVTADGNKKVEKEMVVLDGIDKTLLINTIKEAKSYASLSEIYTAETYDALIKSIENAENILENSSNENEISNAIVDLKKKIDNLQERDTIEKDKISFKNLEAIEATSEADRDFKENAVDGDENTIWHSSYQASDKLPVSITIKLDKNYNLNQIDYLPRQNSKNGHITEYKIETSLDNKNWTEVRRGNLKINDAGNSLANTGYNPIRFNKVKARYVKFTALKTLGDTNNKYASIAELAFYGQESTNNAESISLDKSELRLKVNETGQLKAILNPENSEENVKWESSNEDIAVVDEFGKVRAISEGEAIITAKIANGKFATAKVIVEDNLSEDVVVMPVRDFEATKIDKKYVNVKWNAPEESYGLEGYIIYKDGKKVATLDNKENEYTFNNLKRHTIYTFEIAAKYSNGKISNKESITLRTTR